MGVAPEKAIKLAANDFFRGQLAILSKTAKGNPDKLPIVYGMFAGALAGTVQVIATNPMEAVKIRMQMATLSLDKPSSTVTMHTLPTTFSVVRDLGLRGLYRGSLATLSRDVPFSMIFFQLFATFKSQFANQNTHNNEVKFPFIFASGISAGALGAFLVTPMDGIICLFVILFYFNPLLVVKTRYQASRSSKSLSTIYRYSHTFCIMDTTYPL